MPSVTALIADPGPCLSDLLPGEARTVTIHTFVKAVDSLSNIASPLLVGRRHRLRSHIRADLELLAMIHDPLARGTARGCDPD